MDSLKKIVGRIESRLKVVDLSAAAASKAAGLSASAIYNLKRGAAGKIPTKGGNAATFAALAPVLRTTAGWLMTGEGSEVVDDFGPTHAHNDQKMIPVKGYVGAGARGHYYAVAQGDLDEIPAPPGSTDTTVALEIRGESLGSFFDRWLVVYDEVRSPVTPDLLGKLCIVGLADDQVVIKKLTRGRNGLYNLLSQTGEEDLRDAVVIWAAKVKHMVPR